MKKAYLILLLMLSSLISCQDGGQLFEEVEDIPEDTVSIDDGILKVLIIGNSFTLDAATYICDFLHEDSIEAEIGCMHITSCDLASHFENAVNNKNVYYFYYNKYKSTEKFDNISILDALNSQPWDIVCLQESSAYSGKYPKYVSSIPLFLVYLRRNIPASTRIWFHMTWAYDSDCERGTFALYSYDQGIMINSIVDASRQLIRDFDEISEVVPSGTAIQNARTSSLGIHMTRDGYHLNNVGKYVAGATWYEKLSGKDARQNPFRASGIDDNAVLPALESAHAACADPLHITNLKDF